MRIIRTLDRCRVFLYSIISFSFGIFVHGTGGGARFVVLGLETLVQLGGGGLERLSPKKFGNMFAYNAKTYSNIKIFRLRLRKGRGFQSELENRTYCSRKPVEIIIS